MAELEQSLAERALVEAGTTVGDDRFERRARRPDGVRDRRCAGDRFRRDRPHRRRPATASPRRRAAARQENRSPRTRWPARGRWRAAAGRTVRAAPASRRRSRAPAPSGCRRVNGMAVNPSRRSCTASAPLPARPDAFERGRRVRAVVHEREQVAAHPAHVRAGDGEDRARGDRGVGRRPAPLQHRHAGGWTRAGRPRQPCRAARNGSRFASPAKLLSRRHACCPLRSRTRTAGRRRRRDRVRRRSWDGGDRRRHATTRTSTTSTAAICLGALDGRPCFAVAVDH